MRAAYLAVDRRDMSATVDMSAQAMNTPREGQVGPMKGLVRCVAEQNEWSSFDGKQNARDAHMKVLLDSDWVGYVLHRRSTTRMTTLSGSHLLKHSATFQSSIGRCSAEAEYYALVRGAWFGLRVQSYFADWGITLVIDSVFGVGDWERYVTSWRDSCGVRRGSGEDQAEPLHIGSNIPQT